MLAHYSLRVYCNECQMISSSYLGEPSCQRFLTTCVKVLYLLISFIESLQRKGRRVIPVDNNSLMVKFKDSPERENHVLVSMQSFISNVFFLNV